MNAKCSKACQLTAILLVGFSGATIAQRPRDCHGSLELSGGSIGCTALVDAPYSIDYGYCGFAQQPQFNAYGAHDAAQDGIDVKVISVTKDAADVRVTTYGKTRNQVCAATRIVWEAH